MEEISLSKAIPEPTAMVGESADSAHLPSTTSNERIEHLMGQAYEEYQKAQEASRATGERALRTGRYLNLAKEEVKRRGQRWLPVLRQRFTHRAERTAQDYMRLDKYRQKLTPLLQHNQNASAEAMLEFLRRKYRPQAQITRKIHNANEFVRRFRMEVLRWPVKGLARLVHDNKIVALLTKTAKIRSLELKRAMIDRSVPTVRCAARPVQVPPDAQEIDRDAFLTDIEGLMPGVAQREWLEQATCVAFQNGMAMTFNDSIACRKKSPLRIAGAVMAKALLNALRGISDDTIFIRRAENTLEIQSRRTVFRIRMDDKIYLPIQTVETPAVWSVLSTENLDAIDTVCRFVSTDESQHNLTCVNFQPEYIEACDQLQAIRYRDETGIEEPFLVRGESLVHLRPLGAVAISLTEKWVHFKNEAGLVFSCRRATEKYPEISDQFQGVGQPITLPFRIVQALERAETVQKEQHGDPCVRVELRENEMTIFSNGPETSAKETTHVGYSGEQTRRRINPEIFKEFCKRHRNAVILEDRVRALGANWDHIIYFPTYTEDQIATQEQQSTLTPPFALPRASGGVPKGIISPPSLSGS